MLPFYLAARDFGLGVAQGYLLARGRASVCTQLRLILESKARFPKQPHQKTLTKVSSSQYQESASRTNSFK